MDCHEDTKISLSSRNDRQLDTFLSNSNNISTYFDQIDFEKLPNEFVIKCNHGCKWQYIVKDKEKYLSIPRLIDITRRQITGWLSQEFWVFEGFEMQYATLRRTVSSSSISGERVRLSEGIANDRTKSEVSCLPDRKQCQEKGIEPKILIEPLIRDENNSNCDELNIYCFNSIPKICLKLYGAIDKAATLYDKNVQIVDDVPSMGDKKLNIPADELVKQAYVLSKEISKDFKFVRVDWMIYQNKLYFEELTFTPYSGFHKGLNKTFNEQFSELIHLERYKND